MRDTISELHIQTHNTTSFPYDILCVLTLVTRKLQVMYGQSTYWITALLLEMSIFGVKPGCQRRVAWGTLYPTGELWPHTHMIQHCVSILQAHTYIAIWYVGTHDNKTHIPNDWLHTTHQTTVFLLMMHHFIRTKLASYNTHCSVFSINCVH